MKHPKLIDQKGNLRFPPKKYIRCMFGIHNYQASKPDTEIQNPNAELFRRLMTLQTIPFVIHKRCQRCGKTKTFPGVMG
jgi:hypothetical protein